MNIPRKHKTILVLVLTALILGVFNYGIYAKEQIRQNGTTVLLELAPRDPRSIMQGDYMRLAYQVERDARAGVKDMPRHIRRGYLVIRPDTDNVAQYVRIDDGTNLAAGEHRIRFHRTSTQRVEVVPRSFMFQEGHREIYEDAEYGIFKFDAAHDYILTGLADENLNKITPKMNADQ